MRFKTTFIIILFAIGFSGMASAQDLKIGYVNLELVLAYMPESKAMNQRLSTAQQKLGEKLQIKQQYAQSKLQEYQEFAQKSPAPSQAELESMQKELMKLDEEIKKAQSDAQANLQNKRVELMEPILTKLQSSIDALADGEGYDIILNSVDGNGVSIVLHGPQEHDVTERLMQRLGIKLPE